MSLAVFAFENQEIRFVGSKPVANDVAAALGYSDPAKTVSTKVDKENRTVTKMVTVDGKRRSVTVLEEAGIYQLIFSSDLPSAKKFKNWVFKTVLPEIRKTGGFNLSADKHRIETRDELAKKSRKSLTDEIKVYLEQMGISDDPDVSKKYYSCAHDLLNVLLTTETAGKMRARLSKALGREIKGDLIRDWYPQDRLIDYIVLTRTAAGVMVLAKEKGKPLYPNDAINDAYALSFATQGYKPSRIDFSESIKEVRNRVKGAERKLLG